MASPLAEAWTAGRQLARQGVVVFLNGSNWPTLSMGKFTVLVLEESLLGREFSSRSDLAQ